MIGDDDHDGHGDDGYSDQDDYDDKGYYAEDEDQNTWALARAGMEVIIKKSDDAVSGDDNKDKENFIIIIARLKL